MTRLELDHPNEIVHIEWQFVQLLASTGAVDRAAYYGIRYGPSVLFDGVNEVTGWTPETEPMYETAWRDHRAEMSRVSVVAEASFAENTRSGSVRVTVEIAPGEMLTDISSARIRCAIYEDDIDLIGSTWHAIGRAIVLDEPLTISTGGESQVAAVAFTLRDPTAPEGAIPWGPAANFRAIAFVQYDDDGRVLNAAPATIGTISDVETTSWGRVKTGFR